MIGRYCHCKSSAWNVSLRRCEQCSTDVSTINEDSDGKGSRCLGSVEVPLATFFVVTIRWRTSTHSLKRDTLTLLGRIAPQLHATAQRLVLFPWTRSLTAQLSTPAPLRFPTTISTLLYFPSMLVYHWQRSLSTLLSSIIRLTKATSPPGVTISTSAPVHAERGGLDFAAADERRSDVEE